MEALPQIDTYQTKRLLDVEHGLLILLSTGRSLLTVKFDLFACWSRRTAIITKQTHLKGDVSLKKPRSQSRKKSQTNQVAQNNQVQHKAQHTSQHALATTKDHVWFPLTSQTCTRKSATSLQMWRFDRTRLLARGKTALTSLKTNPPHETQYLCSR